jgi:hypothetical protein
MQRNLKTTRIRLLKRPGSPASEAQPAEAKGQSLVEFALVGVVLFMLLLGIIDGGRLLFTYSVVSNAAQEGARYGVIRPRDVLGPQDATRVVQNATYTPTAERRNYLLDVVVYQDAACNIFAKTRENAWGLTRADVNVGAWYDDGDGTPIPVTDPSDLETSAIPGNRVVVEASYHFDFIVPYLSLFRPNGFDIRMRAARTIVNRGDVPDSSGYNCIVNYTPAPTYTPSNTMTPTWTRTPTRTPTYTPTNTATPNCGLTGASACRVPGGGGPNPWNWSVSVYGFQAGDTVNVLLNSTLVGNFPCSAGSCSGSVNSPGAALGDTVSFVLVPSGVRFCDTVARITTVVACSVTSTPTRTNTPIATNTPLATNTSVRTNTPLATNTSVATNTPAATNTSVATNTPVATNTSLPTSTPTAPGPVGTATAPIPTATPSATVPVATATPSATPYLVISELSPLKPNGSNRPLDIRARVTDNSGNLITGATVTGQVTSGGSWSGSLTDLGAGIYQVCNVGSFGGGTLTVVVNATKSGYGPGSRTATSATGDWCP